jgi:hypothetical protein
MVNSEQSRSQHIIGLPFTVYCLSHALPSALSALRHRARAKLGPLNPDSLLSGKILFVCLRDFNIRLRLSAHCLANWVLRW